MPTPTTAAPYEYYAHREMHNLCGQIGRLQAAIDCAIIKLEVCILPGLEDWRKDEALELIEKLKAARSLTEEDRKCPTIL